MKKKYNIELKKRLGDFRAHQWIKVKEWKNTQTSKQQQKQTESPVWYMNLTSQRVNKKFKNIINEME